MKGNTESMHTLLIFLFGFSVGGFCEYLIMLLFDYLEKKPLKINHRFTIAKRISLLSLPVWGLIAMLFFKESYSYVNVFIASALIGTFLEGLLGRFIYRFFGVRVWTYKYGTIGKFTSVYSLP